MAGQNVVIKVSGLCKDFRSGFLSRSSVHAVQNLDLEIRQGEVFGFLGPNGAGKTTTLRMLTGIAKPTSGKMELFGKSFSCPQTWPLSRIGFVSENTAIPGYMTVSEILTFFAKLNGLSDFRARERILRLMDTTGMSLDARSLVRKLSMGQKRLVDFMLALVNDPEIIFLDEPTVYLDPLVVDRFSQAVRDLKAKGKTIFMSSHTLPLIEKLADRVAIIHKGRLLKVGDRAEFMGPAGMEEEFLRMIRESA